MSELPPIEIWNPDTVRAVAVAYRTRRQQANTDLPAHEAAQEAFDTMRPGLDAIEASYTVARDHAAWFWRGVRERRA